MEISCTGSNLLSIYVVCSFTVLSCLNDPCAYSESFVRGVQLCKRVFLGGGVEKRGSNWGSSVVHQQNAIKIVFRWWVDDGPTLNAGLVAL